MDVPLAKTIIQSLMQDPEVTELIIDIAIEYGEYELLEYLLDSIDFISLSYFGSS